MSCNHIRVSRTQRFLLVLFGVITVSGIIFIIPTRHCPVGQFTWRLAPLPGYLEEIRNSLSKTSFNISMETEIVADSTSNVIDGDNVPSASSDEGLKADVEEESDVASGKEIIHLAFLKVHKAASSTIQNILYRFGYQRNLSFVLPQDSHYLSQNKYVYNRILEPLNSRTNRSVTSMEKYDIICNHAVFNHEYFRYFLPDDAVYFSIIRDPLDLFISSVYYYKYVWPIPYISNLSDETCVTDLIRNPKLHEPRNLSSSRTYNTMSRDFGFIIDSFDAVIEITDATFEHFLLETADVFELVMVVERFQESLILLRRTLNWTFKDILYMKRNVNTSQKKDLKLSVEDQAEFRRRQRFDYLLYDFFLERFETRIQREIKLVEEMDVFNTVLSEVEQFCLNNTKGTVQYVIEKSEWNEKFSVTNGDCDLMLLNEVPFYKKLMEYNQMVNSQ